MFAFFRVKQSFLLYFILDALTNMCDKRGAAILLPVKVHKNHFNISLNQFEEHGRPQHQYSAACLTSQNFFFFLLLLIDQDGHGCAVL